MVAGMTAPATRASTTLAWLDGTLEGNGLASTSTAGAEAVAIDAAGEGGVFLAGRAASEIGINRLQVANSTGLPFADSGSVISALSFWADNLSVRAADGGPVTLSISFSFEGSYVGPCCDAANPSSTFGNAYFLAAPGRFLDIGQGEEDGPISFTTSLGSAVLRGQATAVPGGLLSVASLCDGDDGEDGCDPFAASATYTLDFTIGSDEDFWLAGYFFVGDLAQGESVDAFHSARLLGISIDPGAVLTSESGRIVRRADGSYGLPAAIPEPATWAMMILGFGLVGMRMRRTVFLSYQ